MGRAPVGLGLWWPPQLISRVRDFDSAASSMAKSLDYFEPDFGVPQMSGPQAPTSDEAEADSGQDSLYEPSWGSDAAKFHVDSFTGQLRGELCLPVTPGRGGFGPSLGLTYSSEAGNGPFGRGWELYVGGVVARPRSDVQDGTVVDYLLDGELLVPALRASGDWSNDETILGDYTVRRYRRAIETTRDRIEMWANNANGERHWRIVSADNVTSLYGPAESSRIQDPSDPRRVSNWLLSESYDDRGNIVRYTYKHENLDGVDLSHVSESHRNQGRGTGGWRYPKRISYGNRSPHSRDTWHFHLVFDYGDHDHDDPRVEDAEQWAVRPDPFSSFTAGFEQRVWRRCSRVLMFHRFDQLGPRPVLVSSLDFSYDDTSGQSLLSSVMRSGFVHRNEGFEVERQSEPPITFGYSQDDLDVSVKDLDSKVLANVLSDDGNEARWVDLYSEGLSGVVSRLGDKWLYSRNLGNAKFADPEEVADIAILERQEEEFTFSAQDADIAHQSEYRPTASFGASRDLNADDPRLCYMDLNGDGVDDVVAATSSTIRWYPSHGVDGYEECKQVAINPLDPSSGVRLGHTEDASFHVVDITGDGLGDLVRVDKGSVIYWPNIGRGNFDAPITTFLGRELGEGSGRRCLFASFSGSGSADLVYIGEGAATFFINEQGGKWHEVQTISAEGLHPDAGGIGAVDLFGTGCKALVWVDKTSRTPKTRYISLRGVGQSRLTSVANGQGLEIRVAYSTAVEQWLKDRENGRDWLNLLPVPMVVVGAVEVRDHPAQTRDAVRFSYHHPHFDERGGRLGRGSFVGFAHTEHRVGLEVGEFKEPGLFHDVDVPDVDEARQTPVTLVRSWRHTGIIFEDAELTVALKDAFFEDVTLGRTRWLTGPKLPRKQPQKEMVSAHRAMVGRLLRRETFIVDGPPLESLPLVVEEWTSRVDQLQPSRGSFASAFSVSLNESIRVNYERDTTDPRVSHCINVGDEDADDFVRFAFVDYAPQRPSIDAQRGARVEVVETRLLQAVASPSFHRANVPISSQTWRLVFANPPTASRILEAREIRTAFDELDTVDPVLLSDGPHKRVVSHLRWRYWSNNAKEMLPIGKVESRCLLARTENLAMTDESVEALFGKQRLSTLRFEGGYLVEGGNWWAPGPILGYDQSLFYVPVSKLDAVGRETRLTWNETAMFPIRRSDSSGPVSFMDWHPRTLQVWRLGDQNGNITAWRFGPLGDVMSVAEMGSTENPTGDVLVMNKLESTSNDNPTAVVLVDRNAWLLKQQPVSIRRRQRVSHGGRPSSLRDEIIHVDSTGRFLDQSVKQGSDWVVLSAVFYDARGQVAALSRNVRSDSPSADRSAGEPLRSAATWYTRDGLGRVVRIDNANGTFRLRQRASWQIVDHDENDTVLDSRWYAANSNAGRGRAGDFASRQAAGVGEAMRAAALSASHARTPRVRLLDCGGRIVGQRDVVGMGSVIETCKFYGNEDRVVRDVDARGLTARSQTFDVLGRVVEVRSVDTGSVITQWSATGDKLREAREGAPALSFRYDTVGRLTQTVAVGDDGHETVIERIVWGSGDVGVDAPGEKNLAGYPYLVAGSFGLVTYLRRDHQGRPVATRYQLTEGVEQPDWSIIDDINHVEQVELASEKVRLEQPFVVMASFDALGNRGAVRAFDRVQMQSEFSGGSPVAERIKVSADKALVRRQVVANSVGLGASIERIDLEEGRAIAHVRDENGMLHEVIYTDGDATVYKERVAKDAIGRVTSVANALGIEGEDAIKAFAYDGLGRLTNAEMQQREEWPDAPRSTTIFEWDKGTNLVHVVKGGGKKQPLVDFDVVADSNRLNGITLGNAVVSPEGESAQQEAAVVDYGADGSIFRVADSVFGFDAANRLVSVRSESISIDYTYGPDGTLLRRLCERGDGNRGETVFVEQFRRTRAFDSARSIQQERYEADVTVGDICVATVVRHVVSESDSEVDVSYTVQGLGGETVETIAEGSADGEGESRFSYLPFGAVLGSNDVAMLARGFRGHFHDVEAGLVFMDGGWYSPVLGRWITPTKAINAYAFCEGNPQRTR